MDGVMLEMEHRQVVSNVNHPIQFASPMFLTVVMRRITCA